MKVVSRCVASLLLVRLALSRSDEDGSCHSPAPAVRLSEYAHATNQDFIAKVSSGQGRAFRPAVTPAVIGSDGRVHLVDVKHERFLTYQSDNGWNNQLLNLLCGIDMARALNRTLVIPPFQWLRRRGPAKVSAS